MLQTLAAIIIAGMFLSGTKTVSAKVYYVSNSGNDTNSGTTMTSPWATINRVNLANLEPGDQVLFMGGNTFNGNLSLLEEDAGTKTNPVIISSYGSGKATIDAGNGFGIYVENMGGVEIKNLKIKGSGIGINTDAGIRFDNLKSGGVKLEYVRIDGVNIWGFNSEGIIFEVWPAVVDPNNKSGYRDVRITNSVIHDNGYRGISIIGNFDQNATGYAHENIYIGNTTVYNHPGWLGTNSGDGIRISDINGGIIEHCKAYNNGSKGGLSTGGPVGIWAYDSNNMTIQYNESYGNKTRSADGGGFDLDGGSTNSVMQYNYSHDNMGAGYLLAEFPGARAFHNNTVRYNLSRNDGRQGDYAGIYLWSGGGGISDSQIDNNTVFMTPNSSGNNRAVNIVSKTVNTHLRNNILVTTGGLPLVKIVPGQTGILFQDNDYFSSGAAFKINWAGTTYTSLSAWRTGTGQEKLNGKNTGTNVDPKLANPGGTGAADYKLTAASPLIDAGLDLNQLFNINPGPVDYFGTKIPYNGKFDIGAHEYAGN